MMNVNSYETEKVTESYYLIVDSRGKSVDGIQHYDMMTTLEEADRRHKKDGRVYLVVCEEKVIRKTVIGTWLPRTCGNCKHVDQTSNGKPCCGKSLEEVDPKEKTGCASYKQAR